MAKIILKGVAGFLAILLLLVGIAAVALPRLVNSADFRAALHEQAALALGTPVEWTNVEAGLFPLRLIVSEPTLLAASTTREDARLTADSVDLRLSAMAFLKRRVQVDSLELKGVELVITRTSEGFILPLSKEDGAAEAAEESNSAPSSIASDESEPPEAEDDGKFELAIRRFLISDSRLIVRDQTLTPPVDWHFEDLRLGATGDSVDEPLDVDFSARLAKAGRDIGGVSTAGRASLAGIYDLEVGLEKILVAELQPYVPDAALSGALSGRVLLEGASAIVSKVETKLRLDDMQIDAFGLELAGSLDLEASQTLDDPIEFDAGFDLGVGGKFDIQGSMTLEGAVDAKLALMSLELAPFSGLAGEGRAVSGQATGPVELSASADQGLSRLSTDLKIVGARYADPAIEVAGVLDLGLGLDGLGEDDPIRFDIGLALDGGGHVDAEGVATLAGAADAKVVMGNVALARVAAWVPDGTTVAGNVTGDADVRITKDQEIERLAAKLRIDSARLVSDPVDVKGKFDLEVAQTKAGPIELVAGFVLDDGSRLRVEGTSTVDRVVDINATLETFDLAIAKPFLPDPEMMLAGRASGTGRIVGLVTAPEFLALDLGIEKGVFTTNEYGVEGPLLVTLKVKEPLTRPRGTLELDLTAAGLRYQDQFMKRAGMRAEMAARFVPEESGETVFESRLKLRDIEEILLQGAIGETTAVAVSTTPFNLKGWSEVFPILAEYHADGVIGLEGIGVELRDGTPSQFGGKISLRGIGLTVPDAGRIRLRGSILGEGTRVRTKGLRALVAGTTLGIKAAIEDPLGVGSFELELKTLGDAEVNDLLKELAGSGGILFGLLDLKGNVTGRIGDDADLMETLDGELAFTIGEKLGGTLRGVSILQTILDQVPLLGGAARLSSPFRGGKSVDDYFAQHFEIIEGDVEVGEGRVDARMLRLSYPGYEARLTGPMRLRDLTIDMTGEVLLKGDLVSAMGGLAGTDMADRDPIRIELARVTNTLNDPKVEMTSETLAAIPRLLFQATGLDTIGSGIGRTVGEAIDRVTGGGK